MLLAAFMFYSCLSQLSSQSKTTEHLNTWTSQCRAIAELWLGLLSNTEGWSADPDVSVQKNIVTWKQTLQTCQKVPWILFPLRSPLAENGHTWRKIASAGSRRPQSQVHPIFVFLCSPFLNLRRFPRSTRTATHRRLLLFWSRMSPLDWQVRSWRVKEAGVPSCFVLCWTFQVSSWHFV